MCEKEIDRLRSEASDLKCVQKRLTIMPDKTSHQVMVPIGLHSKEKPPLVMMPGHVKHTNEILCLLGDNWFVERSAKEACGIAERRLHKLNDLIERLEMEKKNHVQWIKSLKEMADESSRHQEIREEYDEAKENEWRQKHRERLREAKLKERDQVKSDILTDEDLMKRLEQLEMEEEDEGMRREEEELFDWRREVAKRETPHPEKKGDNVKKSVRFSDSTSLAVSEVEKPVDNELSPDLVDPIGSVVERQVEMSAKPPQPPRGGRKSTKGSFTSFGKFNK